MELIALLLLTYFLGLILLSILFSVCILLISGIGGIITSIGLSISTAVSFIFNSFKKPGRVKLILDPKLIEEVNNLNSEL